MTANHKHFLALAVSTFLAASCGARTGLFEPASESAGGSGNNGSTDSGSTDSSGDTGSTCSSNGELCDNPSDCCSGICLNGVCSASACVPGEGPVELSAGHVWPFGIAHYQGHVYFTLYDGEGAVKRVPKTGGTTTTIVVGLDYPSGIAVDATGVYVASSNDHQVFRTDTSGGSMDVLSFGEYGPSDIALDDSHVYWVNYVGDQVRRIAKAGGEAETLASTSSSPYRLGVGPELVYWGEFSDGVHAVPKGGGDTVTYGNGGPRSFATDESFLYFTNSSTGGVRRMPLGGGPIEVLYESDGFSDGIAVDASHVYATFAAGEVLRVPKSGGDVEMIAGGQSGPTHIVVDEGCVYWTNTGDGLPAIGNVMRAPKE